MDDSIFNMPNTDNSMVVKLAEKKDIERIKTNIFPYLTAREIDNDGQYFDRIGDDDFSCFIIENEGSIVHYFLVFENAINSPLAKTPLDKSIIQDGDSYLGTAFTIPEVRGLWITPISLSAILLYLRDTVKSKKAFVLVHKDTPGAAEFYKKLGFSMINYPCKKRIIGLFSFLNEKNKKACAKIS